MLRPIYVAAALIISVPTAAQDGTDLRVGQVIGNELGQVVNGWNDRGGGFYQPPPRSPGECCVTLFEKNGEFIVAATVPIAKNSTGGVLAERIIALARQRPRPNEIQVDCQPLWFDPALSFIDEKTKIVRSYFFNSKEFLEHTWVDTDGSCYLGDG